MKSAVCSPSLAPSRAWATDIAELTKPRIAALVLFTVAAGALLAAPRLTDLSQLIHTLVGSLLVAAGASALNQFLERNTDGLMRRTENRPLPSGRMQPLEVLALGTILGLGGLLYLALTVRQPLATVVAGVTLVSYVFFYTPLKTRSTLNTLVGAVPGALPPVIGWTAMTGRVDAEAIALFLIVFIWQVPHFLAIAWIYRDDYARAGMRMLPVVDSKGVMTARQMVLYCLALLPVGLLPVLSHRAGWLYAAGSLMLGAFFLFSAFGFVRDKSRASAVRVLHASLVYLPTVLALLLVERWTM